MLHASFTSYSMVIDPCIVHIHSFKSRISKMQTTATKATLSRRRGVSKNASISWTDEGHSLQINKACIQEHEPVWPDGRLLSSKLVSIHSSLLWLTSLFKFNCCCLWMLSNDLTLHHEATKLCKLSTPLPTLVSGHCGKTAWYKNLTWLPPPSHLPHSQPLGSGLHTEFVIN